MLNSILVLIRTRFLIARNTFWRGKAGRKVVILLAALGLCAAAYGLYRLTLAVVGGLTSPQFARFLARAARETPGLPPGFSLDVRAYLLALPSAVLFFA